MQDVVDGGNFITRVNVASTSYTVQYSVKAVTRSKRIGQKKPIPRSSVEETSNLHRQGANWIG